MDMRNGGTISVVMLPWLAHGHISPFLELAKKLSRRNFYIYFCSTPVNLGCIKGKLNQENSRSIHLVELHLPSSPDLPPHYHTTNGLPPHLMPTLKKAFDTANHSFADILKSLKPDLLIYDILQPWAPTAASSLNIPAILFFSTGAAVLSIILHLGKRPGTEYPFPEIFHLLDFRRTTELNRVTGSGANNMKDEERAAECLKLSSNVILIKTFREMEGKYIDYISALSEKKLIPVGPLVADSTEEFENAAIIDWLNKKDKLSAVLVSFGSEYFMSKEEMEEIAHGLELSRVCFIWVVRILQGNKINNVEEALPEGYIRRVGERGMVVEGWAPQKKILGHTSIGGFVSHCGWSSIMESIKFGVPIVAIPMQIDQPFNAKLLEAVGVGVEVKRNEDRRLEREEIARVIKKVVVEKSGENVRRKVREMSENMRKKADEEIAEVAEELVRLRKRDVAAASYS